MLWYGSELHTRAGNSITVFGEVLCLHTMLWIGFITFTNLIRLNFKSELFLPGVLTDNNNNFPTIRFLFSVRKLCKSKSNLSNGKLKLAKNFLSLLYSASKLWILLPRCSSPAKTIGCELLLLATKIQFLLPPLLQWQNKAGRTNYRKCGSEWSEERTSPSQPVVVGGVVWHQCRLPAIEKCNNKCRWGVGRICKWSGWWWDGNTLLWLLFSLHWRRCPLLLHVDVISSALQRDKWHREKIRQNALKVIICRIKDNGR